jgi:hypothetical protein
MEKVNRTKVTVVAALTTVFLGVTLAHTQPANADTPQGVSVSEFKAVEKGWTRRHVESEFDVHGTLSSKDKTSGFMTKTYPLLPKYDGGYVFAKYQWRGGHWKITGKWWCMDSCTSGW